MVVVLNLVALRERGGALKATAHMLRCCGPPCGRGSPLGAICCSNLSIGAPIRPIEPTIRPPSPSALQAPADVTRWRSLGAVGRPEAHYKS